MMKRKTAEALLVVTLFLIVIVIIYGLISGANGQEKDGNDSGNHYLEEEEEVYYLDGHDLVEFSEVIVEQFHKESELVVWSEDVSVSMDLKQTGIWDLAILNKVQTVTYQGTGRFYVDLGALGEYAIRLDNENCTVTISIPHTKLAEIEIDPEKFIIEDPKKGLLAFGELKLTFQEYNDLERECKRRMKAGIDIKENYEVADKRAVDELTKMFEPIIKAVDPAYQVRIIFVDQQ